MMRKKLQARAYSIAKRWGAPAAMVLLVGTLGTVLLTASHASTPTASLEPESGSMLGSASAINDSSASGGKGIKFGGNPKLYFGTLDTDPAHLTTEVTQGVKVGMLELSWRDYEPAQGQFSSSYIATMKAQFDAMRAAGMQVTLGMGVHYTPDWAKALPNASYIDEHGTVSPELNVIFNQKVRDQVATYYAKINQDFGISNFWAIRLTSGGDPEMLYPGNSYYAFDVNAQNGPDLPSTMARNPLPGWKPGTAGQTSTQVTAWANWYISALDDVTNWQMNTLNGLGFHGYFQTLTPGSGQRPSTFASDIANNLPDGLTGVGAVWDRYYQFLPSKQHVVVYVSSVADHSGNDDSCQNTDDAVAITSPTMDSWSATRFQTRLAHYYSLPVAGENPGYDIPASFNSYYADTSASGMMANALRQAQSCNFQTYYWAHDDRLWDGTQSFSNYAGFIQQINGGNNPTPSFPTGN